jgi:hypothetical protein
MSEITLVVTSCGRLDLLERTLNSFFACNTHVFARKLLIDGSCNPVAYDHISKRYKDDFELLLNEENLGQAGTIDRAYGMVDTEYIFHCEDDWDFHGSGFVEESLEIMDENRKFLMVWIRDHQDSRHPRMEETFHTRSGLPYRRLVGDHNGWKGFSWSPGLRRLADYELIKPYSGNYDPRSKNPWEKAAGKLYARMGFITVTTAGGYCRHTGAGRHIPILNQSVATAA